MAVAGRQAVLGDLFRCPKDHLVHLEIAAPVLDNQGRPLAVVVMRTNADESAPLSSLGQHPAKPPKPSWCNGR